MSKHGNIDPCLRTLGSLGRYQLLQVFVAGIGLLGASYQLMANIFVGRHFSRHECSRPDNVTFTSQQSYDVNWNSSDVKYGQCEIIVSANNSSVRVYPCLFGHSYDFDRHLSFRTEFDLVCDRKLLGSLVQTLVIMGQGVGAVIASILSDRFGRKPVLVTSQLALLLLGLASGLVPTYAGLAALKFIIGAFQQGVITSMTTISIEWFPAHRRSVKMLISSSMWAVCMMLLSLIGFLMRHQSWRHLQIALSSVSAPIVLFHFWYLDESLRWLMANDRKEKAVTVLQRAARVNKKDFRTVLSSMPAFASIPQEMKMLAKEETNQAKPTESSLGTPDKEATNGRGEKEEEEEEAEKEEIQKMTILDLFRHRHLLINASIMWIAWFTCAFAFFTLYMMSHSLHGNRFINYFLNALMELVPGIIFFFLVDRVGRKRATTPLFVVAGVGLITSGVCRIFTDSPAVTTMSVVMAMVGILGASGMFSAVFFYTPELFPTNLRNQALGLSSSSGRLGGMLSPFMVDLAEIAVWAPGAMIGSLCFLVVVLMHFLPETKGRELPNTVHDIDLWYSHPHQYHPTTPTPPLSPRGQQQQQQSTTDNKESEDKTDNDEVC